MRFTTAAALVNELVEAKHQFQLRRVTARWSRYDVIAIDEVGYVPLAEVGAEFLFQVIAERAERTAVIITTNLKVLDRYQINWLRKSGDELRGRCPIHEGEGQQAFHVNLAKNAFHCFSCKAHGNVLDFVAAMEKCSVRDAAVKLQEWFSIDSTTMPADTKPSKEEKRGERTQPENKPPAFELKGIDLTHPYLRERGITKETAETFRA